jgi:thiamine kinase-like enzyme
MTAEVYEWGSQQALKLYYEGHPLDWIRYEADIGMEIIEAGVPAPNVYEMLEVEGRRGLVYERIQGPSVHALSQSSKAAIFKYAREMAKLHASIHCCTTTKLPLQKERLEQAIKGSSEILKEQTLLICTYLHTLPDGDFICHGDFHPDNVLITPNKPIAIDWINANRGDPMGDAARTSLMFLTPYNPPGTPAWMFIPLRFIKKMLNRAYLKEYCKLTNTSVQNVQNWILPVAAARLQENIPGERSWLLGLIDQRIKEL